MQINNIAINGRLFEDSDSMLNIFSFIEPKDLLPFRPTGKKVNLIVKKILSEVYEKDVVLIDKAFEEWKPKYKLLNLLRSGVIGGRNIKLLTDDARRFDIDSQGEVFISTRFQDLSRQPTFHIDGQGILAQRERVQPPEILWRHPIDGQDYLVVPHEEGISAVLAPLNETIRLIDLPEGGRRQVYCKKLNGGLHQIVLTNLDTNEILLDVKISQLIIRNRIILNRNIMFLPSDEPSKIYSLLDGKEVGLLPPYILTGRFDKNKLYLITFTDTPLDDRDCHYQVYSYTIKPKFKIEKLNDQTFTSTSQFPGFRFCWDDINILRSSTQGRLIDYIAPNNITKKREVETVDLSRFGRILEIKRHKDNVYIHSTNSPPGIVNLDQCFLHKINLGNDPLPPIVRTGHPPLTLGQSIHFAARKWVRYTVLNGVIESVIGALLQPNIKGVVKAIIRIMQCILFFPIIVVHDAGLFSVMLGSVIMSRNPKEFILDGYKDFSVNANLLSPAHPILRGTGLSHMCPLTNRRIMNPARLPGNDKLYEETSLEEYIIEHGRDPDGNPRIVTDIIPDTILRARIWSYVGIRG